MTTTVPPGQSLRATRGADWARLETLLDRVERGSTRRLADADLLALPVLYRSTLSSLSVARATVLDQGLLDYLEDLSTRAYFVIYGTRVAWRERLVAFFARDWPAAARALWRETMASAGFFLAGAAAGWLLAAADPDWFTAFVPAGLANGRDPAAATEHLRSMLHGPHSTGGLPLFSTFLFTHNAQISILAFALGFAFCLPTALLLLYNGGTLGAFFWLYAGRGLGAELGGWLSVHGVTEIFAVILAGAAGFHIGTAVAAPGRATRLEAAARAGRRAAVLMAGVGVMLLCAAFLEGIVRQVVDPTPERYAIGFAAAALWITYFYAPRGRPGVSR